MDKVGFKKARAVYNQIKGLAETVGIIQLPVGLKGDVVDFIQGGGNLPEQLSKARFVEGYGSIKPVIPILDYGLKRAFEYFGISYRNNLANNKAEFCLKEKYSDIKETGTWLEFDKPLVERIKEDIRHEFLSRKQSGDSVYHNSAIFGGTRWGECFGALLSDNRVDPFKDWLNTLQPKQSPLLDTWLEELFEIKKDSKHFITWASRYLFLGAVQRTLNPGCKLDQIPVLIGQQGIGKSAVGQSLLPPEFENWFGDTLDFQSSTKEIAEAIQGKVIVEIAEMVGSTKADIERIKSVITRRDDGDIRMAYKEFKKSLPRRCIFYGTTNEDNPLPNDQAGNRRFVVLELLGKEAKHKIETWFDKHRLELWQGALWLYQDGQRANLNRALLQMQRDHNEKYRSRDVMLEDRIDDLKLEETKFSKGITLNDLTQQMFNSLETERLVNNRSWQIKLGSALKIRGWERKRLRDGNTMKYVYYPPT